MIEGGCAEEHGRSFFEQSVPGLLILDCLGERERFGNLDGHERTDICASGTCEAYTTLKTFKNAFRVEFLFGSIDTVSKIWRCCH